MVWVAITEAGALIAVVSILARLLISQQRAHARREDLLINQLLHATGRAWQPAPAVEADRERERGDDLKRARWTASPEQHLVNGG